MLGYCDCCTAPDGSLRFVYGTADAVACDGRWTVPVPREPLDLRCGFINDTLVAVWKDGDPDGGTVRMSIGVGTYSLGLAFGTNSVCVGPDGIYIVRSDVRIEVVYPDGKHQRWIDIPATTQGIRDITPSGELRLGDAWFVREVGGVKLYQPCERNGVTVGQTDPPQIAGYNTRSLDLFTAILGAGYEPHIAALPGGYAVCARTPNGPTLVRLPPYPPFHDGTDPEPEPIPPNPETPVKLPDHVFNTLKAVRAKYPTPLGNQGAAVLNEVAWIHRSEGYGLESKDGGFACPQPKTGEMCGCDILRTLTKGWDVLGDAEGAGTPTQSESGTADPSRFVDPVTPGGVTPIPPTPTPGPTPPSTGNALPSDWVSLDHWINVEIQQIAVWYREKHGTDMGLSDWAFQAYRRLGPELWTMAQIKAGI
jgi:hypothetical protein